MNHNKLHMYLTSKKLSKYAVKRAKDDYTAFDSWLKENRDLSINNDINLKDLDNFIQSVKKGQKKLLLGLSEVFEFQGKEELRTAALKKRMAMLNKKVKPMRLHNFLKVNQELIAVLKEKGVRDAHQLLRICRTHQDRIKLSQELNLPYDELLNLVKMADLSRIHAVKAVRTRLYLESGFDTLDKLSSHEPLAFHLAMVKYVEESGFDGIPTTPKEAEFTIKTAQKLDQWIIFDEDE